MTTTSVAAIQAEGLAKAYGATRALCGVDLEVQAGTVLGLLGPNGAGKTTAIRILATLTRPDAGSAKVLGYDVRTDPHAVRGRISLTGQFATLDASLSGMENLLLQARLLGLGRREARRRSAELLDAFGLASAARRAVKTYSGGMRRRLDIAASMVVAPSLLFLDEPTTGLDPRGRRQVWEMVRWLAREGTTVLLTTQYLDEADQLADRIAVIDHGKIIADGTPGELKASVGSGVLHVRLAEPGDRERARQALERALGVTISPGPDPVTLTARLNGRAAGQDAGSAVGQSMSQLSDEGITVTTFALGEPSLDEVFLALTGHTTHNGHTTHDTASEANVT
jgi:ABC-2 type transport system ATP-binding protein